LQQETVRRHLPDKIYHQNSTMTTAEVNVFGDSSELGPQLCSYIEQAADLTIAEHGRFVVAVSGGSMTTLLARHLPTIKTDWTRWHVFLADERVIAHDDPECTCTVYKRDVFRSLVPEGQIYGVDDPSAPLKEVVDNYTKAFGAVKMDMAPDLVLLGMGPDGHTASLFPGHASLESSDAFVGIADSPKPPPQRISMTFKTLNSAASAVFIVTGKGKAKTVARVLSEVPDKSLPAANVNPTNGMLVWYLDNGAASLLKPPIISPKQKSVIDACEALSKK
jgi:6-phosphogluconolactonase